MLKAIILKTLYNVEGEKKEQMYKDLEQMRAARHAENEQIVQNETVEVTE
jgi:hypothetical protein